jgi:exodeoxyribonuclease VII small subunit
MTDQTSKKLMQKKLTPAGQPSSFEAAMAELEQLVAKMEAGELPLEASVAAYQRGSELVKYCNAQLEKVDGQVKILEGEILRPFAAGTDAAPEADE